MSAREMFEKLAKDNGYKLNMFVDDYLTYFIPIGGENWEITFNNNEISICANNITPEELIKLNKAIQQQIKELGWEE